MVQKFHEKVSRNSRNCLISEIRTISPKILEIPGAKFFKKLGITREVVLLFGNFENVVPFATGSCRKFKPDVLVEWKAPKNK